ncbi:MAG: protein kinase [Polyangiaceae bacterium]|nr:protein kinase [Polyangiaceae bacterium]
MDREDPEARQALERVGRVLRGKWRLDRVLGIGGMGTVYAATHRNGLRGAVKILHPDVAHDETARTRFLREGYLANRVGRGAVKVLDEDATEDGLVYLVMELLDGSSVEAVASKRAKERLDVREVLAIGIGLMDVLDAAHSAGIVHRDIKPENLFLTSNGELRVLDFGIARLREMDSPQRMTATSSAMGTPAFMPPEQALAHWDEVGTHSDIYSAGATLFTLLTGELTHEARSTPELLVAVATRSARPLQTVCPETPVALAQVIDRALAHKPADRWASAKEMGEALRRAAVTVEPGDFMLDAPTEPDDSVLRRALPRPTPGGTLRSQRASWSLAATAKSPPVISVVEQRAAVSAQEASRDTAVGTYRSEPMGMGVTTSPVSSDPPTARSRPKSSRGMLIALSSGVAIGIALLGIFAVRLSMNEPSGSAPQSSTATSPEPTNTDAGAAASTATSTATVVTDVTPVEPAPSTSVGVASASSTSSNTDAGTKSGRRSNSTQPARSATSAKRSGDLDLSNPN